jgi:hypothetical protein
MAKKVIKINTNPSNKTKIATSSPSTEAIREWSEWKKGGNGFEPLKKGTKPVQKIITSTWSSKQPPTGKTIVSSMAKARGRIVGSGMGGMFGIKNR